MTDVSERKVYLSGPVTHHSTPWGWRVQIEAIAPFEVVNPCEEYDENWPSGCLIDQCYIDIQQSDGVIVGDTGHLSPGTWREVQFARERGKPIVVWDIDSPREDFVEVFHIVETRQEAVEEMVRLMEGQDV